MCKMKAEQCSENHEVGPQSLPKTWTTQGIPFTENSQLNSDIRFSFRKHDIQSDILFYINIVYNFAISHIT